MVENSKDVNAWCRENLSNLVKNVDIDGCVIIGESAGANIAMLFGHCIIPRPRALVTIYGPTDFLDPHFDDTKSPPRPLFMTFKRRDSEEKIRQSVADRDPANAITMCPSPIEHYWIPLRGVRKT
jgi:acetyl esterase/lipase